MTTLYTGAQACYYSECLDEQNTGRFVFQPPSIHKVIMGKAPFMCGTFVPAVRLGNDGAREGRFVMTYSGVKANKWVLRKAKFDVERRYTRKELEQSGIYAIVNLINGNVYIGQSKNIWHRHIKHLQDLRTKKHGNAYLQNAFNRYGECNFKFTVIEFCSMEDLDFREQYWIEDVKPAYNIKRNIYEDRSVRMAEKDKLPDGITQDKDESFTRPDWHKWVYGGSRKP